MMIKNNLNIIIFSEFIDRIHYGLTIATASKAINQDVTLFFSMKSISALTQDNNEPGWIKLRTENGDSAKKYLENLIEKKIVTVEELITICIDLDIKFMICEMGMKFLDLNKNDLRKDITYIEGGLLSILDQSENSDSRLLFI